MITYFARHPTIANLLMIAFLAIGAVSAPSLQRATFPRIDANTVQVTVAYPGASPETVEEAICQRIEDAIDTVDGVAEIECESRENQATATIEMAEGQNLDRFSADVKTEIDAITDFPDNAEVPIIKQIGRTDFVASVAIAGPKSRPDLKAYAEQIKDRMKIFGGIPKIEIKGFSDEQIRIEIPDATLRQYGLSFSDIANTIRRQNVDLPAGNIATKDGDILLRISDQRKAIDPLKNLIVVTSTDGGQIKLGDIARIDDRFEDDEVQIVFNGQPAALLDIIKSESDDAIRVTERVKAFLDLERQRAPPGVTFTVVSDGSTIIRDRLDLLLSNGAQGLLLVGIATWMFFGFRYSFWIVMGLPVAFMGGIAAMAVLGYSINMLTMVGLLIVVGILMDDAIVISENIASKSESGLPPMQAAGEGALEVMPGVLSSFLTTFCIFGSLAFLKGDIGQLIRVIPVVMIAVLVASLVEAFLILPHHLGHALHKGTETVGRMQAWTADFMEWMRTRVIGPFAEVCVKARYLTMGIAVGALVLAITAMATGVLKFSPFPTLDGDTLEVRILLPQGTPLERTKEVIARINGALDKMDTELTPKQPDKRKLILNRTVRYNENAAAFENGSHVATLSVDVLSSELRTLDNDAFFARWRREVGIIPDVLAIKYTEPSIGPAGQAIDIRLKGRNLETMKAASVDLQAWLHRYVGVVDLIDDLRLGKPEVNIRIRAEGATLGLHAEDIANQIRAAFFGTTVDEIQTATKSLEIDVRLAEVDRDRLATLDNFVVKTPEGRQVPLSAVATLTRDRGFARINRIDGVRTISVQGEVDTRFANAAEVISDTRQRFLPQLQKRYPDVTFDIAGQDKETGTTQASMMIGFMIGLVGVFLVLSFQFRSYMEPIVVMILIPFAFIGAVIGHITLGIDFTMPSMLGFAALAGIVVNDSILLVNQIKEHHDPGSTIAEVAPKAVQARFRAIFLTSITTVLGLLPLLLETSLQAQVLIPLVTSLAFGLMASTILVLFVVPTFYAILDDFGLTTLARERKALATGTTSQSSIQPAE